jgi:hypothetical protein
VRKTLSGVTVLFLTMPSHAGILPSFKLVYSAWHATDIVVVSEGEEIDGKLTVLAVWEGGLSVGDTISVPQLRAFASRESRTVGRLWKSDRRKAPLVLPASRMVLFLKRAGRDVASDKQRGRPTWQPATLPGAGMKFTVVWIAESRVYAFTQVINPGPSVLTDQRYSEAEMRIEVERVVTERRLLRRIAALRDARARATQAAKHVGSTCYDAREEAFSILSDAGEAALPVLGRLLRDETKAGLHSRVVKALAAAGGETVAVELTDMVEHELRFWKKTAPGLKRGWWNAEGIKWEQVGPLRDRYSIVLEVFYALRKIRSPVCRDAVTRFRDYWRSLPQLDDRRGLDQMSNACDAVLRALPEE